MPSCKHCATRPGRRDQRGLCNFCYGRTKIRAMFPELKIMRRVGNVLALGDEPTEEELDQMIAEQLPTMPAMEIEAFDPKPVWLPQAVKRGQLERNPRVDRKKGRRW